MKTGFSEKPLPTFETRAVNRQAKVLMDRIADLNDTLIRSVLTIDDGCNWTQYLIWIMNSKRRIRNGINEPPPARPRVAPVKIGPVKKPLKRGVRKMTKLTATA